MLTQWANSRPRFVYPYRRSLPKGLINGICLFYENGERYGDMDRIVMVGSHTSQFQLIPHLDKHFSKENKNISILRKNIGCCFLHDHPYLPVWNLNYLHPDTDEQLERSVEIRISAHLRNNFSFSVLPMDTNEERDFWKPRLISTIAQGGKALASANWLGKLSPKAKIRDYALWQVNDIGGTTMSDGQVQDLISVVEMNERRLRLH